MTTSVTTCPWWCSDHRTGETAEDEQHARLFAVPGGTWVAILCGVLPTDRVEFAFGAESYDADSHGGRAFGAALQHAADVFDSIRAEARQRPAADGLSGGSTP